MKILFNIPVHENMDVVCNIVENIKRFVQNPIIVFHVNPLFRDFDPARLAKYSDVIVNPTQLNFIKYQSLLHILMANFYQTETIDYDYHCFFYSNEMFIRPGIENYIKDHDCVFEDYRQQENPRLQELIRACSEKNYFDPQLLINNHVEGTLYSKKLIKQIFDFVLYNMVSILHSQTSIEETVIPTLAYMYTTAEKRVPAYNHFQDWDRELTSEQLNYILEPNQPCLVGHTGYNIFGNTDHIFTVKPVHRTMQSQLRRLINSL